MRITHPTPALLALLLLAGCGPLVQIGAGGAPPESLLVVESSSRPTATPNALGMTLAVELPQLTSVLQTLRLPVRTTDSEIRYLTGASWAETPSRQFQRLISDTLASRGMAILDRSQASTRPVASLSGTLRDFTLDVRNPAQAIVIVRYDAQLAKPGNPKPIALRRFEMTEPVASQSPPEVAAALGRAANRLAAELADWTSANLGA
ncbi:ABC-type transport auxiliary lipoprotein family protein [Polymorphobacter sp.]|uniref:ABC-type transport auxiliary lipoprotein family protein n=1 Tax=Polymorphobacter sp. TaxID=1909290 RepID=UPI003F717678